MRISANADDAANVMQRVEYRSTHAGRKILELFFWFFINLRLTFN